MPRCDAAQRTRDVECALASGVGLAATDAPRLRYGGDAAFAPFESLDAQGRPRGFQIDLTLQSYAFGVAPGQAALQTQLQQGLDRLETNGRLEALRVRWLGSHRGEAERALLEHDLVKERGWTWGVAGASGAALLLMGAGLWLRGRRIATERAGRAQAEAALRQAQDLLDHTFVRHADLMLIVERGSGMVRDANPALMALLGVPAEQLIGSPLHRLGHHVEAAALQPLLESLADDGALDALPLQLRRADGQPRDCLVSADPLQIDGAAHVFCIVRDITEQLAREAALRSGYDALTAQLAQAQRERDAARERQARAQEALTEFTRGVAHDLKAPLHAVQGFAGLLRDRVQAGRSQEAVEYLTHIDRAAQRMTAMIGALARLGQVTQQTLVRQTVDMARLVEDTCALIAAAHPETARRFASRHCPPRRPTRTSRHRSGRTCSTTPPNTAPAPPRPRSQWTALPTIAAPGTASSTTAPVSTVTRPSGCFSHLHACTRANSSKAPALA